MTPAQNRHCDDAMAIEQLMLTRRHRDQITVPNVAIANIESIVFILPSSQRGAARCA